MLSYPCRTNKLNTYTIYMQYSNEIMKLLMSYFIRVLSTLIILYKLKIPIYTKIILLMLTDSIDCSRKHEEFLNEWINCNSNVYTK